ncbi:hypothetical protein PVAND_010640 [Polypedilum vanderplanki]|uniref:Cytochrome P450 n=1 Tax=Polypedilum vanderplanki TaxID=319348 RepID=A0A9J6CHY1_POLVA|nr:hypothetical protein PVAND_010640 [Polypedilum vanderplanki]
MIGLIFIAIIVILVHLVSKYYFNYWKRRGFPQMDATFLFGNISDLFLFRKSFSNCFMDFYEKYKHKPFIGSYFSYKPVLIVNDPLIIQDILVSNFSSFTDRPRYVDEKRDPISAHLFNIGGQKWRDLRFKLSPTFSSGKIKGMFPIMRDCGRDLQNFLIKNSSSDIRVFNFIDLFGKYTTHNIVNVIFSIDSDCFSDPENIFRKMSANFAAPSHRQHIVDIFSFLIPNILHGLSIFNIHSVTAKVNDFVLSFVEKVVKHREETNFSGNDFLQLLIQLKNQGFLSVKKGETIEKNEMESNGKVLKKLTIDEIAAQVLVFFVGGFETSSATMSFCLFELCKNPHIQRKVQEEIDRVFGDKKFDDLDYEMINNLKYLECCIDETLRLYPPLSILFRTCTKDYKIPNTDLIVEKGTSVHIPSMAIQRDENIFENASEFRSERFLDSPTGNGQSEGLFYLPFGSGPRICLGARMGKLQTKIGLASILREFSVEFTDKSMAQQHPGFQKTLFFLRSAKPFNFKVTPRK